MASDIGITGLAVMGQNLARNMARHGFSVALHNRSSHRTRELVDAYGHEGAFTPTMSLEELVSALSRPRKILVMVKAGPAVDEVAEHLATILDTGDIIIDGGNSHFEDTRRRESALRAKGLHFIGTGVSGGEEGALNGPSLMPGGSAESYQALEPIFTAIAAKADGVPCCTHVGPDGAGHFVKMVHNGIEYADMQLIAEAYDLLTHVAGLTAPEIAAIFDGWNEGDLESFLVEITAKVLSHIDESTGRPLVDMILDEAEQKGTGRWTAQSALELGVPVTTITEAVYARSLSARKAERNAAARVLAGPSGAAQSAADRFVDDVRGALYASKVVAYAQGFEHIAAGSAHYDWGIDAGAMATIWRGGCIIRARFLDRIRAAYDRDPGLTNLLLDDYFREAVAAAQDAWRRVIGAAVDAGVPVPAFTSSLAYYDGYRRDHGPANLIQGLRDFFGAHTYRRVDRPGSFHTRWAQDGKESEV